MESAVNFKLIYEAQIKDKLSGLESLRKIVLKGYIFCTILFIGLLAGNYYLLTNLPYEVIGIISIIISCIFLGYFLFQTNTKKETYRVLFKSGIVTELIKFINPEWQYQFDRCISESVYKQSGLFTQPHDRLTGDDLVTGIIDKTDFEFSELHTEYKKVSHDNKGRRQVQWVTIFKGLFMHADFNKEFAGTTYVLPDTAERLFGSFGQSLQKMSSRGELVKLENPEFEKRFVVYGSNQIEARYILTPTMMEAMVKLYEKFSGSIQFSFVGSRVYCAMDFSSDLFEPTIFKSGLNFDNIKLMYNLISVNTLIINELNLNTRIWTKE